MLFIAEFAIQLALQVTGNHAACQAAVDHGELDLNVWESLIVFNVLDSMALLATAASALEERCVAGLEADAERNQRHADTIIPLLTRLTARHSYSVIADIVKVAGGDPARLRQLLRQHEAVATNRPDRPG